MIRLSTLIARRMRSLGNIFIKTHHEKERIKAAKAKRERKQQRRMK